MNIGNYSLEIAQDYAEKVRLLFALSGKPTGERGGGGGSTSPQDLAQQAESLSPVSASLTQALAREQTEADSTVRFQASLKLLAKALTDLEISAYLYQAAIDEEDGIAWPKNQSRERSVADLGSIEENLQVLLGVELISQIVERGEAEITDIPTARVELSNTVVDTLNLILERASQTGESALTRVMGLGVAELAQAVGFVGMDIAEVLGQSENVSRLYNAFRDFFNRAYESVIELLGRQLAETAAKQVLEWIQELKEGANLIDIVERFYQTEQTAENLQQLADSSTANLEQFITAIQSVSKLDAAYRQQINWAENVLQGLKWFGTLSAAVLPQGQLLIAALCITLGGYVILVGADYVDSPNLTLLDCVPGVRRIVENHLATGIEATANDNY